jgi:transposase
VNRWVRRYRTGGWEGLAERRRGRRAGEQPALAEPQQQEVIALVRESTPDQLGLPGFLWTRDAVAELIGQRYGLWLARTTVGGYLRGWGFSPQKPQRRALEQNPAAVRRWLDEEFPTIRARAKREGGVVLWLDEMGVRSDAATGRSWAPIGKTHQADRQAVPGQHDQRHLQCRAAAVPAVCRVIHRSGVHRLPASAAA